MFLFNKPDVRERTLKAQMLAINAFLFHAWYLHAFMGISKAFWCFIFKFKNKYVNFIQSSEIQHTMFL